MPLSNQFSDLRSLRFPAQYLEVVESLVASCGMSRDDFYHRCKLSPDLLSDPGASINGEELQRLLRVCGNIADPTRPVSAQLLEHFPLTAHGTLGIVILTSPNLSAALSAALRFYPIVMPAYDISREDLGDQINLIFKPLASFEDVSAVLTETILGAFNSIRRFIKPNIPMLEIHFSHANAFPLEAYSAFADPATLHFNQPCNRILVSKKYLQESLLTSNRATLLQFEQQLEQQIAALHQQMAFTQNIREHLAHCLRNSTLINVETVAEALHTSTRTLGRRLQQEGTTFKDLVNETRLDYAEYLLLNSAKSISQIGYAAGFTNDSSFSRAFRKRKGVTPTEMRRRLADH